VGSFEADVVNGTVKGNDGFDAHGDSLLVAQARLVLEGLGIEDFAGYTYEDKASNAPMDTSYVMSHDDRAKAVRNGTNPAEKQAEISENIDKAEAKIDKANSKHKNDAKPRTNG
jgi:hypothetical protein